MTPDERAYELLKWQSLAPLSEFDPAFPYFDVWKAASDNALNKFDKEHERREKAAASRAADKTGTSRGTGGPERERKGLALTDEEQGFRIRRTRGRKRC